MFRTLLFLLVTLAVPMAVAQQPLSSDAATAVVKEATRLVRENYVFADKVDGIVTRIEKQLADGRYAVTDPQQLATRLTEDLQAVTSDKHMSVKFNPEQAAGLRGPRAAGNDAFRQQQMTSSNYGILEMRVSPGQPQRALRHTRRFRNQRLGGDGDSSGNQYRVGTNRGRARHRGAGGRSAGRRACRCAEGAGRSGERSAEGRVAEGTGRVGGEEAVVRRVLNA